MALYAELHRHLGGSVVPRILWRYFHRADSPLGQQFPEYPAFEEFYTRPRNTLDEYLELHTLVESVQTAETLPYFIYRLIRGAYVFENLAHLELRDHSRVANAWPFKHGPETGLNGRNCGNCRYCHSGQRLSDDCQSNTLHALSVAL